MSDDGPRAARDADLARLRRDFTMLARAVRALEARVAGLEALAPAHDLMTARELDEAITEGMNQLVDEVSSWHPPR